MVVDTFAEWLLLIPEVCSSKPVISKSFHMTLLTVVHSRLLGQGRFKPCHRPVTSFAFIRLYVGDQHAVVWHEGPWALATQVKIIRMWVRGFENIFTVQKTKKEKERPGMGLSFFVHQTLEKFFFCGARHNICSKDLGEIFSRATTTASAILGFSNSYCCCLYSCGLLKSMVVLC